MIVEWKEVNVDGYKVAVDTYEAECSIKDFTNTCTGEVIDVRHEQPGFFSKGKTIYIVRSISDNSIREVEATKCKVKYK